MYVPGVRPVYVVGEEQLTKLPYDVGVWSRQRAYTASPPSVHANVAVVDVVVAGGAAVIVTDGTASADGANTPTSTAATAASNASRPPDTGRCCSDDLRD